MTYGRRSRIASKVNRWANLRSRARASFRSSLCGVKSRDRDNRRKRRLRYQRLYIVTKRCRKLPPLACAVQRRRFPVGASPTRQPLQPEAIGAVMEVTKWLKPSISVSRIGDSASVQAATRVNVEQASKRTMCRPTRLPYRGRLKWLGELSEDYAPLLHRGIGGGMYTRKAYATREASRRGQR